MFYFICNSSLFVHNSEEIKPDRITPTAENSDIAMYESSYTELVWGLDDDIALGASLIRGIGNVESSSLLVCAGNITPGDDYLPLTV